VVVAQVGALTLDGQVHQLAPMVIATLPKGTVRAIGAVDGPVAQVAAGAARPAERPRQMATTSTPPAS
jgi:hypothetical protein